MHLRYLFFLKFYCKTHHYQGFCENTPISFQFQVNPTHHEYLKAFKEESCKCNNDHRPLALKKSPEHLAIEPTFPLASYPLFLMCRCWLRNSQSWKFRVVLLLSLSSSIHETTVMLGDSLDQKSPSLGSLTWDWWPGLEAVRGCRDGDFAIEKVIPILRMRFKS